MQVCFKNKIAEKITELILTFYLKICKEIRR